MTSERFWEVTEGYFAEGHKEGWLDKLLALEHLPKDDDPAFAIPDPGSNAGRKKGEGGGAGGDKTKQQKPSSPKVPAAKPRLLLCFVLSAFSVRSGPFFVVVWRVFGRFLRSVFSNMTALQEGNYACTCVHSSHFSCWCLVCVCVCLCVRMFVRACGVSERT